MIKGISNKGAIDQDLLDKVRSYVAAHLEKTKYKISDSTPMKVNEDYAISYNPSLKPAPEILYNLRSLRGGAAKQRMASSAPDEDIAEQSSAAAQDEDFVKQTPVASAPMTLSGEEAIELQAPSILSCKRSLSDIASNLEESFSHRVLRLIDERDMKDADVYKRAGLDRRVFAKLRKDEGYVPSRQTALALTIGLMLNLDDAHDLLAAAGFSLSHSSVTDLVVEYFLRNQIYDIMQLNQALHELDQKVLV